MEAAILFLAGLGILFFFYRRNKKRKRGSNVSVISGNDNYVRQSGEGNKSFIFGSDDNTVIQDGE